MSEFLKSTKKIQGRLRSVANAATPINAIRSLQNGAVRLRNPKRTARPGPDAQEETFKQRSARVTKGAKLTSLSSDVEVNVFVLYDGDPAEDRRAPRDGRVGVATVTLKGLQGLAKADSVRFVELAETIRAPDPRISRSNPVAPAPDRFARLNAGDAPPRGALKRRLGENVLVGIIDVGGLDFTHADFMDDDGKSRIIRIWDQAGDAFDPPSLTPDQTRTGKAINYGSEITANHIAVALREAAEVKASPHDLAPQAQQIRNSHATHVASIAAGRSGLCKRARIAAVLLALPEEDNERGKSFYDTTRIIDGLAYLFALAKSEGLDAVSVNISLGTNGGAHDGSEMMSRWIDSALTYPGRSVTVAAGNSGQEAPQYEGDLGIWSGRVHSSGRIPAAGLRNDLEWVVVGNGVEDVSENEMEIWYSAQDEFEVELIAPNGQRIGPIAPEERIENLLVKEGSTVAIVSIYSRLVDPRNGDNRISIYLSPFMGDPVVGVGAGSWRVRLIGKVVRNGSYSAWIERDDPMPVGGGPKSYWRLPSFFGARSFVDNSTLSSLACGPRVIGVANLDEAQELINVTSSQGPTRDGRPKPEIAAPGTRIVAACGFDPGVRWIEMTGTSMASPHVAGVAALMLSLKPDLTAAQIGGIIQRTAKPLPGHGYEWRDGTGFGVVDPGMCLREVMRIGLPTRDRTGEF